MHVTWRAYACNLACACMSWCVHVTPCMLFLCIWTVIGEGWNSPGTCFKSGWMLTNPQKLVVWSASMRRSCEKDTFWTPASVNTKQITDHCSRHLVHLLQLLH